MTRTHYALVVVGGGPAGHTAAKTYREAGGSGPVLLVSADVHLPYNRPPLSKEFLRGESEADALALADQTFYPDHDIEVLLGRPVTAFVRDQKRVVLGDAEPIGFDRCVLATGSAPVLLPVDGGDHPDLLFLRSRIDGERLRSRGRAGEDGRGDRLRVHRL